MTGVRVALDTNIAIAILNQDPVALTRYGGEVAVALPAAVVGELMYGALNSQLQGRNRARYVEFISNALLLPVDEETANHYAHVRYNLKRSGRPIPENDLWIAATCLRYGLTLCSHDAHFGHCSGLTVEDWLQPRGPSGGTP